MRPATRSNPDLRIVSADQDKADMIRFISAFFMPQCHCHKRRYPWRYAFRIFGLRELKFSFNLLHLSRISHLLFLPACR